ncbi:MAG: matrixin family metalloprotease [Cytophagaceae bacterium]|nr:matrixin family metalloprotease [Cytophagaceae bacterium]MDW8455262.1 matrixin family metalloprotease [Cytophagaceae bacterium]
MNQAIGLLYFLIIIIGHHAYSQCMQYPVSFAERVSACSYIVLGKVSNKQCYWNDAHTNIYTAYTIDVMAYLKNPSAKDKIILISDGGVVSNEAQLTYPSVHLEIGREYLCMLDEDERVNDNKEIRKAHPEWVQARPYALNQGVFQNINGKYKDYFQNTFLTEESLLNKISKITGCPAVSPSGAIFKARMTKQRITPRKGRITAISSFSPNPTVGGTIVAGDFITITGSGFGSTPGTVFFTNADDGGATYMSSAVASDIVSWSNTSITVKVPEGAGTGPINVNGAFTSTTNLTVTYTHANINSSFSSFGTVTRQRYYHRNMNGAGGMYFQYNTTSGFSTNTAAVAAFERALETWRCATYINWFSNGTTTAGYAADGINSVLFDNTLPAGVLGVATSRFSGAATGACNLHNTVWCVNEVDIQFKPNPPATGFTWQYGPAAPSSSQYDFESVALHELGHAHGLGHVINSGKVMHYALPNGQSVRTLDPTVDVAAGNARMAYSTSATCFNPGSCGSGPMVALTPGTCSLPIAWLEFSGKYLQGTGVRLLWTSHLSKSTSFHLYRSNNATDYELIHHQQPGYDSDIPVTLEYTDFMPYLDKGLYYKLEVIDETVHSKAIYVDAESNSTKFSVFTSQNQIWIRANDEFKSSIEFSLYDMSSKKIFHATLQEKEHVIDAQFRPGIYCYTLVEHDKIQTGRIFIR